MNKEREKENRIESIEIKIKKEIEAGNTILIRIVNKEEIEIIVEDIKRRDNYYESNSEIKDLYKYKEKTILNPVLRDKNNKENGKDRKIIIKYGDTTLSEKIYGESPYKYYKVAIKEKTIVEINREEFWEI